MKEFVREGNFLEKSFININIEFECIQKEFEQFGWNNFIRIQQDFVIIKEVCLLNEQFIL